MTRANGVMAVTAQTRMSRTSWLLFTCHASRSNCAPITTRRTVRFRKRLSRKSIELSPTGAIPVLILFNRNSPEKLEVGQHFAGAEANGGERVLGDGDG